MYSFGFQHAFQPGMEASDNVFLDKVSASVAPYPKASYPTLYSVSTPQRWLLSKWSKCWYLVVSCVLPQVVIHYYNQWRSWSHYIPRPLHLCIFCFCLHAQGKSLHIQCSAVLTSLLSFCVPSLLSCWPVRWRMGSSNSLATWSRCFKMLPSMNVTRHASSWNTRCATLPTYLRVTLNKIPIQPLSGSGRLMDGWWDLIVTSFSGYLPLPDMHFILLELHWWSQEEASSLIWVAWHMEHTGRIAETRKFYTLYYLSLTFAKFKTSSPTSWCYYGSWFTEMLDRSVRIKCRPLLPVDYDYARCCHCLGLDQTRLHFGLALCFHLV